MRKVFAIAWNALSRLARDRKSLVTVLLMPMVLIGILGAALGAMVEGGAIQPFDVVVVNADQALTAPVPLNLGKSFVDDVLASDEVKEVLKVQAQTDLTAAKDLVAQAKVVAAIYVPPTFSANVMAGKATALELYTDPGNPTYASIVEQIAGSFTEYVNTAALATGVVGPERSQQFVAELESKLPKLTVTQSGSKKVKMIQYYAAAMAIMFMVMTAFMRSKDILQSMQDGTLARILTSPTSKATVIMGQIVGTMVIILSQFLVLMLGTHFIYQVDWGPWGAALLLGTAFSLAAAGIGTAAAGLFKEPRTADSATGVVGMLFAALSGAMFPLFLFPEGLRMVSKFIPNYWALQGFLDQMSGLGPSYLYTPVLILCSIGLVTGAVGAWRLASK